MDFKVVCRFYRLQMIGNQVYTSVHRYFRSFCNYLVRVHLFTETRLTPYLLIDWCPHNKIWDSKVFIMTLQLANK
jgi:hypothetical protein